MIIRKITLKHSDENKVKLIICFYTNFKVSPGGVEVQHHVPTVNIQPGGPGPSNIKILMGEKKTVKTNFISLIMGRETLF